MHRVRHQSIYYGWVILGPQPINWINRHRSLGKREFFYSRIKFDYPRWERLRRRNQYRLEIPVLEGTKTVTVEVLFQRFPHGGPKHSSDYVFVRHAHIIRKKRWVTSLKDPHPSSSLYKQFHNNHSLFKASWSMRALFFLTATSQSTLLPLLQEFIGNLIRELLRFTLSTDFINN